MQERFLRPEMRTLLAVSDELDDLLAALEASEPVTAAEVDRPRPGVTAVFDGHNDALGKLQADDAPGGLPHRPARARLDLPRARAGGLAGGLFAINVPSPRTTRRRRVAVGPTESEPVDHARGDGVHRRRLGRAHALAAASDGAVAVVTDVAALDRCRADGTLAIVLHLEGAEAIDPGLSALDAWHAAGVRSLGPVWSRPNAFGHGVPFRFPASPDTGPGLTEAGLALVRRCAQLGIVVDVSHLNAAGFADVARLAAAPSSRRTARAMRCPRHAQPHRRPVARGRPQRRPRGDRLRAGLRARRRANEADTPLANARGRRAPRRRGRRASTTSPWARTSTARPCPAALGDVAGLPRLLDALRDDGFGADEVERIAWGNWRRVLGSVWAAGASLAPTPRAAARTRRCRPPAALDHALAQHALAREAQALGQRERAGVVGRRGELEAPHPGVVEEPVHDRPTARRPKPAPRAARTSQKPTSARPWRAST